MKAIFDGLSYQISGTITRRYSTSFSLGIKSLDKKFHNPIYAIYGFVRLADEIVDSFHDFPKEELLNKFEADTWEAIDQKISLNPVLNCFQDTVNTYKIDADLIKAFLHSMRMDLSEVSYHRAGYEEYIYGSAEVVGLMCLRVFAEGDLELFNSLKPAAKSLGSAFQKVNFLRDIQADFEGLGRTYFPSIDLNSFSESAKEQIQREIQEDFDHALEGILKLPTTSRFGVYLAYVYYTALFKKICRTPASQVMMKRIRIPNAQKMGLWFSCYWKFNLKQIRA